MIQKILSFIRRKTFSDKRLLAFNCQDQDTPIWIERAKIAVELVASIEALPDRISVADIGCGDMKLKAMLEKVFSHLEYRGYDLVPQSEHVQKLDVEADPLSTSDVVTMLGVGEYLSDLERTLDKVSNSCRWLVISHSINDNFKRSAAELQKLNWKRHLSSRQFSSSIESSGFHILDGKPTTNGKVMIWLCKSTRK